MSRKRADPPMQPSSTATTWYESGPELIYRDPKTVVLLAQLGMASNALHAHLAIAVYTRDAGDARGDGSRQARDLMVSLASVASVLYESLNLARPHLAMLKQLANAANVSPTALETYGRLDAGSHPASPFIKRARNKLAYHWDPRLIRRSVNALATYERIVWMELDVENEIVHTFAHAILTHALFPFRANVPDETTGKRRAIVILGQLSEAVQVVGDFFTAAVHGFIHSSGALRRIRKRKR